MSITLTVMARLVRATHDHRGSEFTLEVPWAPEAAKSTTKGTKNTKDTKERSSKFLFFFFVPFVTFVSFVVKYRFAVTTAPGR
ncbi:MAG TPA: hypothetical protein VE309_06990 [Caulobacteraceae bacterium]|nr:hypothetical protein [Caulobacteraceae bacterium]